MQSNNNINSNNMHSSMQSNNIQSITPKKELNVENKRVKKEDIIFKTPVRNYSWDDLKILSSI
jgi:hypothetical protein